MKARPILFTGSMIRRVQSGAKTQTRRTVKGNPDCTKQPLSTHECGSVFHFWFHGEIACPFGQAGDLLWVKETFCSIAHAGYEPVYFYRADGDEKPHYVKHWKPSIFCSRKASRITLEIMKIRVQRLQQISEEDAIAEGAKRNDAPGEEWDGTYLTQRFIDGIEGSQNDEPHGSAREWYRSIWETINGRGSWDKNPWVWVIEFNPLELSK